MPDRKQNLIIVLGCMVRPSGLPSSAMQRRVARALAAARELPHVLFLPVGGVGRFGPAEAEVMAALLTDAGVPPSAIVTVPEGTNTISSLRACWPILRRLRGESPTSRVYVCTDRYHVRRCRIILQLWGIETEAALPANAAYASSGHDRGTPYMRWRDRLALLKDVPSAAAWRFMLRSR